MSEQEKDIYVSEEEIEMEDVKTPAWKKIAAIAVFPLILIVGGIVLFATRNKDGKCECASSSEEDSADDYTDEEDFSYVDDEESEESDDDMDESEDE